MTKTMTDEKKTGTAAAMSEWTPPDDSVPFPQADALDRILAFAEALGSNPRRNDLDAAKAALDVDGKGLVARQVSYYTRAGEFLGLLDCYSTERWRLTRFGKAWRAADESVRGSILVAAMRRCSPIFDEIAPFHLMGALQDGDAETFLALDPKAAEDLNPTTAARRAKTVLAWIDALKAEWIEALGPEAARLAA